MCIEILAESVLTRPMVAYKVVIPCDFDRPPEDYMVSDRSLMFKSFCDPSNRAVQSNCMTPGSTKFYWAGHLTLAVYPGLYCFLSEDCAITYAKNHFIALSAVIKVLCPEGSTILWSHEGMITTTKLIPIKCVFICWEE